jgi:hypothetical protein
LSSCDQVVQTVHILNVVPKIAQLIIRTARSIWREFGNEFETIIAKLKRDSEELNQIAIAAHMVSAAEFQKGIIRIGT